MRGGREPEARGHAHARAESRAVEPRDMRGRGRLGTVLEVARGRFRIDQRLVRIHGADLETRLRPARKTVLLAQLRTHLRQQRILDRQREIVDADARRVELAARAADDDQRLPLRDAPCDQRDLRAHAVDRIDHVVEAAAEQRVEVVGLDEILDPVHTARGIDQRDPLGHRVDLRLAVIAVERVDLPVRIAFRDVVEIDQRQRADRVARERLGHPRPDAADADHRDVRALERGGRRRAVQARDAAEAPRAIHVKLDLRGRGKIRRTGRGSVGSGHGSKENVSRAALYFA